MELLNKIYADGMGPTYDYTPEGRLSRRTWARGIVTDYAYDAWGNLTNTVYSDGTPTISLDYDAIGRQTSAITERVLTNLYFYSAYGELTNEVQNGVSIARSYDTYSRPTGYLLCDSASPREINYIYDASGHFSAVEFDFNAEPQSRRVEYGYLPGTDLVSGYTSGDFSRSVSYEPHRDLIAAVTNSFNSSTPNSSTPPLTIISTFAFENDAAGRRISRIDTFDGGVTTNVFGYNMRSEVTSAAMGTNSYGYAYDPIGNRLFASHNTETNAYTANALNQYTSITNLCASAPLRECLYDADGNMTADERGWHYFWNGENRMVSASNSEAVVTYAYDHRGRMVSKEILPTSTNSTFSTLHSTFVWDGWNIIRETATGLSTFQPFNLSTSYVWGLDIDGTLQGAGGVGGLLAVIQAEAVPTNSPTPNSTTYQLYLPTYDANGNVTEYVATNGAVVAHYEYSAFGEPTVSSGELASTFTHQFSTKPYCATTGFNEYQMRKYRPNIGRWMSRDPMAEKGSMPGLYMFCGNDSMGLFDYLGEDAPNIGSPLLPLPANPSFPSPQFEQPDKPKQCGECCETSDGKKGRFECQWKGVPGHVTGGIDEKNSHGKWKRVKPKPDRTGRKEWWNPTLCFDQPKCGDGWQCMNSPPLLINKNSCEHLKDDNGNRRGSNGAPDHEDKGRICYELNSRPWGDWSWKGNHSNKELGVWCMKCQVSGSEN